MIIFKLGQGHRNIYQWVKLMQGLKQFAQAACKKTATLTYKALAGSENVSVQTPSNSSCILFMHMTLLMSQSFNLSDVAVTLKIGQDL